MGNSEVGHQNLGAGRVVDQELMRITRAIRDGDMPTISRWLREGSHRLASWETDWSSQTGACQAGLLHGYNGDMPAFRWWEKDRDAPIVTNHPKDAVEIERRHSDGKGLLHADGASRANILSGDATHSMLTMSTASTQTASPVQTTQAARNRRFARIRRPTGTWGTSVTRTPPGRRAGRGCRRS